MIYLLILVVSLFVFSEMLGMNADIKANSVVSVFKSVGYTLKDQIWPKR